MSKTAKYAPAALSVLSAETLQRLVSDAVDRDRGLKQSTELELALAKGSDQLALLLKRRLKTLATSKAKVSWKKTRQFLGDLDALQQDIVGRLGPSNSDQAAEMLWSFLTQRKLVEARPKYRLAELEFFFEALVETLLAFASGALDLVPQILQAIEVQDDLAARALIPTLAPVLDQVALDTLITSLNGMGEKGRPFTRQALSLRGDVKALRDSYSSEELERPQVQAELATAFLNAGQAKQAAEALVQTPAAERSRTWLEASMAVSDAAGMEQAAQDWAKRLFLLTLEPSDLDAYVRRFPDFEDEEARDALLDLIARQGVAVVVLGLFIKLGEMRRASNLVIARLDEMDASAWQDLNDAIEVLEHRYFLSATLIRRRLIDTALRQGFESYYQACAKHLIALHDADPSIEDYEGYATHHLYLESVRSEFQNRFSFWAWVADPDAKPVKRRRSKRRRG